MSIFSGVKCDSWFRLNYILGKEQSFSVIKELPKDEIEKKRYLINDGKGYYKSDGNVNK